jgi:hypothetical protein
MKEQQVNSALSGYLLLLYLVGYGIPLLLELEALVGVFLSPFFLGLGLLGGGLSSEHTDWLLRGLGEELGSGHELAVLLALDEH